ncbi:hypothetical protein ABZV75_34310 [Streptomyces flaveolus]|uniref:hypothetical protein n=1 Tax=Streptomyces flaveolus TaxID=67297 RepID=UPI0033BC296D
MLRTEEGRAVEPVRRYLIDFAARYNRPGSVRSYAFDLLRWWRWLRVADVPWALQHPSRPPLGKPGQVSLIRAAVPSD